MEKPDTKDTVEEASTKKELLDKAHTKNEPSKRIIVKFVPEDEVVLRHTIKVIQQSTDCAEKKGPSMIVRSVNLNDGIQIRRRFGEGAKPLFDRDDVKVNTVEDCGSSSDHKSKYPKGSSPFKHYHGVLHEKSPDTSRNLDGKHERGEKHDYRRKSKSEKTNLKQIISKQAYERSKKPYFSDPIRERDRLRRLYGSPNARKSRSHSPSYIRRRSSPRSRRVSSSPRSRRSRSRSRRRSSSRDRSSRRHRYDHRTHHRSRTRSPRRNRSRHRSSSPRERDERGTNFQETPHRNIPPTLPAALPNFSCPYHIPQPILTFHGAPQRPFTAIRHFAPPALYGGLTPTMPYIQMPYIPMPAASYRPHTGHRYPPPRQNISSTHVRNKKQFPKS
ncbi:female-specific protein transformer [Musca vetustissima]|uniref:female-specific protein transformer n=1 Tax=Musca vetustissima TaxID=27455 RepID=UPI002AB61B7A|nr:female-specific protein transformer [Musca vetustissima]